MSGVTRVKVVSVCTTRKSSVRQVATVGSDFTPAAEYRSHVTVTVTELPGTPPGPVLGDLCRAGGPVEAGAVGRPVRNRGESRCLARAVVQRVRREREPAEVDDPEQQQREDRKDERELDERLPATPAGSSLIKATSCSSLPDRHGASPAATHWNPPRDWVTVSHRFHSKHSARPREARRWSKRSARPLLKANQIGNQRDSGWRRSSQSRLPHCYVR